MYLINYVNSEALTIWEGDTNSPPAEVST